MVSSESRPKRIVVTGGRGRLAALIADHFRAPRHVVKLYSRSKGSGFHALDELTATPVLAEADTLLHLAWSTLPTTSEQHPGAEQREDLPRLEQLLTKLGALPVNQRPHFIFFSSGGAVYGNAPGRPSLETDPCRPIGRYGQFKLAAEQLIQRAVAQHSLPCTILRITNPYGYPVPSGRVQGIIPHAVRAAVESRPLTLWGDGHARKDFIYHTDFLSALEEVVAARLTGTFNLGAGESHSINEILALVEAHTGRKIATQLIPSQAWDVQDSQIDISRLSTATGWSPQVSLSEGIRRSTTGFLDH
jgi:UDP-glucose 4-epimerase